MRKDVILVRPPRTGFQSNFISIQEPVSLCCLAAYVEKHGFKAAVWDLEQEVVNSREFIQKLKEASPFIVGFTCYTPTITSANNLAALIKDELPEIVTVVGGPHSSALPVETLNEFSGFDVVVVGEGEVTLNSLVTCISEGKDIKGLDGIAFRDGGNAVLNPNVTMIKDLDILPYPARHLLNWDLYRNIQPTRGFSTRDKRITSIYTSRGCPGKCIFCATRIGFGNKVRFRSVDSVLGEVEECIGKYKVGHIVIQDDTFNLRPTRVKNILEGFKKLGVSSWSCDSRVDFVTREMIFDMVDAGCKKISFGVESGSPRILDLNKKGITIDHVRNAVKWSKEAGLKNVETNFMIGSHPDETREDLTMTEKLIRELSPDIVFLSVVVPYPGTEVYKEMKERGLIFTENWDDYVMIGAVPEWRTEHFSAEELVELQKTILRRYYFRPAYIAKKLLKLRDKSELSYWLGAGIDFLRYNYRDLISKR